MTLFDLLRWAMETDHAAALFFLLAVMGWAASVVVSALGMGIANVVEEIRYYDARGKD